MNKIEKIKQEYINGDLVMSELLRNYDLKNTEIQELLDWSGDSEFISVDDVKNLVVEGENL